VNMTLDYQGRWSRGKISIIRIAYNFPFLELTILIKLIVDQIQRPNQLENDTEDTSWI
jgi:hypothetical protein